MEDDDGIFRLPYASPYSSRAHTMNRSLASSASIASLLVASLLGAKLIYASKEIEEELDKELQKKLKEGGSFDFKRAGDKIKDALEQCGNQQVVRAQVFVTKLTGERTTALGVAAGVVSKVGFLATVAAVAVPIALVTPVCAGIESAVTQRDFDECVDRHCGMIIDKLKLHNLSAPCHFGVQLTLQDGTTCLLQRNVEGIVLEKGEMESEGGFLTGAQEWEHDEEQSPIHINNIIEFCKREGKQEYNLHSNNCKHTAYHVFTRLLKADVGTFGEFKTHTQKRVDFFNI